MNRIHTRYASLETIRNCNETETQNAQKERHFFHFKIDGHSDKLSVNKIHAFE